MIESSDADVKNFCRVIGIVSAVIGGWLLWHGDEYALLLLGVSFILIVGGIIAPWALRPLQKLWMAGAIILGWIITRIILAILFYGIVTPIGVGARFLGKRFLTGIKREEQTSYWVMRTEDVTKEKYERQF
ncbi:MAG: hypothetical protein COU90_02060 [Candidatus Ryanbacteria bacterium CG10_big_fil_rev_8_21_14_0_10_43_42]|uniref:SxtJ n=1 Tax=Candidatus Ryanbacteria bacterium CG10_big_fil_rev_8_21_14_0_10_43_42 TaxID=1974864 RepID=A0A2M8KXJ6_9BACT|nr:MAG: hypothetical protein COU90_02060 [Candidatus Ryanbacteria bacterium CG10_big_fil_rev_8_21_14_0_10_43_42]